MRTSDLPPTLAPPVLAGPYAESTKYTRGKVVVIGGAMPGAALLAAHAAQRSGAGYVELLGPVDAGRPWALVRRAWEAGALADERIGAVVIGPGLGRQGDAAARLEAALACPHPLVIDADALNLLGGDVAARLARRPAPAVLTPHAGEFARLFGEIGADRAAAARRAAAAAGAIVVLKGSRTVIADGDGRALVAAPASPWLATAGTGDVLAGITGAMLAQMSEHGFDPFAAAGAAVWLHGEAARLAGPALTADDLVETVREAVASCSR